MSMRTLGSAQSQMRTAFVSGGVGVIVSGTVWMLAALAAGLVGAQGGMLTLFLGGMLIFPVSGLIEKRLVSDPPPPDKRLSRIAIFTLPILFGGLFLGYIASAQNPALFFSITAIAIGLRYLSFQRIYGLNIFLALGAVLIAAGGIMFMWPPNVIMVPLVVGVIELIFGVVISRNHVTGRV